MVLPFAVCRGKRMQIWIYRSVWIVLPSTSRYQRAGNPSQSHWKVPTLLSRNGRLQASRIGRIAMLFEMVSQSLPDGQCQRFWIRIWVSTLSQCPFISRRTTKTRHFYTGQVIENWMSVETQLFISFFSFYFKQTCYLGGRQLCRGMCSLSHSVRNSMPNYRNVSTVPF